MVLPRALQAPLARHPRLAATLFAAVVAGTVSTAVQIALWLLFTDAWPGVLARDSRLAAALVLGPGVLPPPLTFDPTMMTAATIVHAVLSLAYAAMLSLLVGGRSQSATVVLGAAFGLALYFVNMYGFTSVFPWFVIARGWITAVAHLAFGISGALAYTKMRRYLLIRRRP